MNKSFISYLLQLLGVALIFIVTYSLLKEILVTRYYEGAWKIAVLFLVFFSATHYGMIKKRAAGGAASVRFIMAATAIKMFLMMIVLLGYIFLNRAGAVPFVICFFMCYLFFMVFDVAKNYKLMRDK